MPTAHPDGSALNFGTRREPFFDGYLIDRLSHIAWELVDPVQTSCEFAFDQPWEGAYSGYSAVIQDGGRFLLYYRGTPAINRAEVTCCAGSRDGRTWTRPALGRHPHGDRHDTNIVLIDSSPAEKITHNFTPFLDPNPAAPAEERFKAVGGDDKHGLFALGSADGIHWRKLQEGPVLTAGVFDSQNVPFWSATEQCYVLYFRIWTEGPYRGLRSIARTTSADFRRWTEPLPMTFEGAAPEELYTNVTMPCPGAPHLYVALPSRFVPKRQWMSSVRARELHVLEGREGDVSDTVFMTSRGGNAYQRCFPQAYLRPGPDEQDWVGRNSMVALGLLQLDAATLGFYRSRHYASDTSRLTLHTMRTDGFARLRAGASPGRMLTRPFIAAGDRLCLNFATSAAGTVRIEALTAEGRPIAGFSGRSAARLFGDSVHHPVAWPKQRPWSELNGRAIRLRFTLGEADLYALQQI
jgi:hypothetical protein